MEVNTTSKNPPPASPGGGSASRGSASAAGPAGPPVVPSPPSGAQRSDLPIAALAYVGGLFLLFVGERVLPTIAAVKWGLTAIGIAGILTSIALRAGALGSGRRERRAVERGLLVLTVIGLLAVLIQLSTTEEGERLFHLGEASIAVRSKFESIATSVWVALLACATAPLLFAERALYPMRRAEQMEGRRVLAAAMAGLAIALAATYATLATFGAGELDLKADFSYFRTSRPSETTRKMLASANDEITIQSFFPELNEVGIEVNGYLRDLVRGIGNAKLETYDRLLVPAVAKESKVTQDGVIVLKRGTQTEPLQIGDEMSSARPKLKTLDTDFQKTLNRVMRQKKTAYLTVGHGELNEGTEGHSARGIRRIMETQGYAMNDLGLVQGLGNKIPDDATVVLMLGPKEPLLPGEMESLRKYIAGGGHLLLALDPDAKFDLEPLAELAQLSIKNGVLANENVHVRIRFNDSDRTALITNRFSSHASVSTLSRNSSNAPVIFEGAAALDKWKGSDSSYHLDFTVHAMPDTFIDANSNLHFDQGEEKGRNLHLAAAVSKAAPETTPASEKKGEADKSTAPANETRLFVVGDSDVFSDMFLNNGPNVVFFLDALRWLGGEESFAGEITTTEDVKIEHTRQKDLVWFYSTIAGVPLLVLALGLLMSRKPQRSSAPQGAR